MSMLDEMLRHNERWMAERGKEVSRNPHKKIAIFTCMDTRLVEFLEPALGIGRGDAKIIKNAGATLVDPGGGVVRSLVVAVYALDCEEILVVGHRDCGMSQIDEAALRHKMIERGVQPQAIDRLAPNFGEWLGAFHDPVGNVERVVKLLRDNPLLPRNVPIHGLVFDPHSGRLELLVDGSKHVTQPAAQLS